MNGDGSHRHQAVVLVHDVVSALRAIAAGRMQGARRVLQGTRRYHQVVLEGLAVALGELGLPPPALAGGKTGLLAMTSEQAFAGALDQAVLDLAERQLQDLGREGPVTLVVVGRRGARHLATRHLLPDALEPGATSLEGLQDLAKRLAALVAHLGARSGWRALYVVYSRYVSIGQQVPTVERILPPDFGSLAIAREPAQHYCSGQELLAGLVSEFAFISLFRLAAEAYISEQASRLVAMDAATRNAGRMLEALTALENQERRDAVTREMLETLAARIAHGPP